jgi:hypothetical protein
MGIIRTVEVRWKDVPFDRLPQDLRAALTDDEATAYRAGPTYFREMASRCSFAPIEEFLLALSAAEYMYVHFYAEMEPEYRVYFGVRFDWKIRFGYRQAMLCRRTASFDRAALPKHGWCDLRQGMQCAVDVP